MIELTWFILQLLIRTRERVEYKDSQVMDFVKQTVNHTAEKLISDNARYHKKCYANFANASKVERAQKPVSDSTEREERSVIKQKADSPSAIGSIVTKEEVLTTCSKP